MNTDRSIKKVVHAADTLEGGGVIVARGLPHGGIAHEDVDPFLLLDEARIDPKGPGFPEHPHRGFEIITYILEGWGSHKDNLGNQGRIEAGGVMKLTAGSGIWHGEQAGAEDASTTHSAVHGRPADGSRPSPSAHGIQFWVNLPKAEKKRDPEFQLLQSSEVPEVKADGSLTRVIVGKGSPLKIFTPMNYLDVTVDPGKSWQWDLSPDWQGYAYVLEGAGKFGSGATAAGDADLALLGPGSALEVLNDSKEPLRFMLAAGKPIRERVIWNGPFVD
jgi:redox-sensitive bicupin YhaK (pirin superfamily)